MYDIYHNLAINTPEAPLFNAITIPDQLNQWWTLKSSGQPDLGAKYNFWFAPEYDWEAEIISIKENVHVSYKMIIADKDWTETILTFELEREADKLIRLHFFHSNWKEKNTHFGQTSYCWAEYLRKLKTITEN